jgi:hypothetical protein
MGGLSSHLSGHLFLRPNRGGHIWRRVCGRGDRCKQPGARNVGPEPLEGRVKCLVSIGTGVPSLKPFRDDVLHIGETLVAIATDTEQTAEMFQRERALLDTTGRYYRFGVLRGLEDIGLEEAKKVKEMAAATRRYISSQEVHKRMQACASSIAGREC